MDISNYQQLVIAQQSSRTDCEMSKIGNVGKRKDRRSEMWVDRSVNDWKRSDNRKGQPFSATILIFHLLFIKKAVTRIKSNFSKVQGSINLQV